MESNSLHKTSNAGSHNARQTLASRERERFPLELSNIASRSFLVVSASRRILVIIAVSKGL